MDCGGIIVYFNEKKVKLIMILKLREFIKNFVDGFVTFIIVILWIFILPTLCITAFVYFVTTTVKKIRRIFLRILNSI